MIQRRGETGTTVTQVRLNHPRIPANHADIDSEIRVDSRESAAQGS